MELEAAGTSGCRASHLGHAICPETRRQRLRRTTRAAHEALEARLARRGAFDSVDGYARYLAAVLPLQLALEWRLDMAGAGTLLPDWPRRRKAGLIREDLRALGRAVPDGIATPAGPLAGAWGAGTALGVLYVLEGATLGGAVLGRRMAELGLARGRGASFLDPYGPDRPAMWRRFLGVLEDTALPGVEEARLAEAAHATFAAFEARA